MATSITRESLTQTVEVSCMVDSVGTRFWRGRRMHGIKTFRGLSSLAMLQEWNAKLVEYFFKSVLQSFLYKQKKKFFTLI